MAASGDEHGQPAPSASLQPGKHNANKRHVSSSETPLSPEDGIARAAMPEPLFYNYLRVLHDFDPSTDLSINTDENSITVSIKQGDLILVHATHENGWADGTLFSSGIRGWVPTNYCEVYDHTYIRNMLNGMTQFWDLLEHSEAASLQIFIRQEYIRGLIAGVRCLLEHASRLHRDATLVQRNVGIRRTRKSLLVNLSSMVSQSEGTTRRGRSTVRRKDHPYYARSTHHQSFQSSDARRSLCRCLDPGSHDRTEERLQCEAGCCSSSAFESISV